MSGSRTTPNPVSNEDIIEDITKNLRLDDTEGFGDQYVINPDSKASNFTHKHHDNVSANAVPEQSTNSEAITPDEKCSDTSDNGEDFINIEELKDRELTLTDDQRAEYRIVADELKQQANNLYKEGEYEDCCDKYTEALRICPLKYCRDRAILFSNRAAAKMKLEKYESAVLDCSKSIDEDDQYIKPYLRRAQCYEKLEKLDESLSDYKKVVELDSGCALARSALVRLPPLIDARNERLKTEMMSKLKDLGNMFLKPFGLSTENFQMNQDPQSKGYTINFKQ